MAKRLHYNPNHEGRFKLAVDRETFNGKVIPWLTNTLGNRRGKKQDWVAEEQEFISERDVERIKAKGVRDKRWSLIHQPYWAMVHLRHNRDAVAFIAQWGDHIIPESFILCRNASKVKNMRCETVTAPVENIVKGIRWMHRNVQPGFWAVEGYFAKPNPFGDSSFPTFTFHLRGDDAHIAFLMVKP